MADLIDRAVLEIDAWERLSDAVCALEKAPAVDAVEVVRCKDCKHYGEYNCCWIHSADVDGTPIFVRDDDFCSYGERRTDV